MSRLMYAIAFTKNFDSMREFYEKHVGLRIRNQERQWVEFDTSGAVLALHDMPDDRKQGLVLRFETADLDAERRALAGHGVHLEGEFRLAMGRLADVWDPEGNLLSICQPERPAAEGKGPTIERVILNARDFGRAVAFYRGSMRFPVTEEAPHWVEFDTGDTRLAVHHRPAGGDQPRHAEQPIAVVFATDDLTDWCEGAACAS